MTQSLQIKSIIARMLRKDWINRAEETSYCFISFAKSVLTLPKKNHSHRLANSLVVTKVHFSLEPLSKYAANFERLNVATSCHNHTYS